MALGIAALVLLIITLLRIKNRKVVYVYDKVVRNASSNNQGNDNGIGLNS